MGRTRANRLDRARASPAVARGAGRQSAAAALPITPARIESAIAPTFANLVQTQVSWLGLPPMRRRSSAARRAAASCHRRRSGAGEWICTLVWMGPHRQTLRDTYDLFVATDGCYTARRRREPRRPDAEDDGRQGRQESPLRVRRVLRHDDVSRFAEAIPERCAAIGLSYGADRLADEFDWR